MIVKFATLCDHCRARSDEYTAWPTCTDCGADTCPTCMVPDSLSPGDGDRVDHCYCLPCRQAEATEESRCGAPQL